jgi:hypothetical protein
VEGLAGDFSWSNDPETAALLWTAPGRPNGLELRSPAHKRKYTSPRLLAVYISKTPRFALPADLFC